MMGSNPGDLLKSFVIQQIFKEFKAEKQMDPPLLLFTRIFNHNCFLVDIIAAIIAIDLSLLVKL